MANDRREVDGVKRDGVDLISSLPDAILQHIFSLIPTTEYAIRTSVLSKRWRHVWSETTTLDIHCYRSNFNSVNETLARYYSSPKITSFRLSISITKANEIDRLIDFAMSRNTEKLSLEFGHSYAAAYRFSEVFFTSCSLKQLFIESITIGTIPGHITVSWRSLKTLSLRGGCAVSDETFAKILSGSPLLECLTLSCAIRLERLDLSKSPMLKRLDVECCEQMLQIVAPHLCFLRLTHIDESRCELVDVSSSLTEAKLNFGGGPETGLADSLQVMILETLHKLQNVEKLTLCGAFCLHILSLAVLCGVPFPMFKKMEALTLETAIYPSVIPGVVKLLQNSPRLKTIVFDTVDGSILEECRLTNYLYWKGLDTRQCWKPKDLSEQSLSEPGLMSSVMKFLLKTSGNDWYKVGTYTFSQNKNSELSFVT